MAARAACTPQRMPELDTRMKRGGTVPSRSQVPARPTVWTSQRRLLGNLIPALVVLPFAVAGLYLLWRDAQEKGDFLGWGLVVFAVAVPLGWLAVNFFGLYQNAAMRREMQQRLRRSREKVTSRRYFVGFSTPVFRSVIDAHQDVGYIILHPDKLEFYGDVIKAELRKDSIIGIRFRANPHTLLGLGRWISVEGLVNEAPVRMLMELRECATLLGNLRRSKALKQRLETWLKEAPGKSED